MAQFYINLKKQRKSWNNLETAAFREDSSYQKQRVANIKNYRIICRSCTKADYSAVRFRVDRRPV